MSDEIEIGERLAQLSWQNHEDGQTIHRLTAELIAARNKLAEAKKVIKHYAAKETWGYGYAPNGIGSGDPQYEYLPDGNGYDLAADYRKQTENK